MVGRYPVKSIIYNDLSYFADPARQVLVSLPSLKRKMYPIHIGGFTSKERICASQLIPRLSARSNSILTDEGCHLVRPRGVRSRIDSSRSQIA